MIAACVIVSRIMTKPEKIRVISSIAAFEDLIDEFKESVGDFLFRGASDRYSMEVRTDKFSGKVMEDGINSFLYRSLRDKVPFSETFCPFHIEGEMLHAIWEEHPDLPRNREGLLTDLQHHFDNTNVIDFTNKLPMAGFFVGYGKNKEKDGEIIILDRAKIKNKIPESLAYKSDEPFIVKAVETDLSQEIVTFQGSVFVYPPAGYISKDLCHEIIQVPANIKKDILDYLHDKHGINECKVFEGRSDKFSTNKFSIETASVKFHYGIALGRKGKYEESIVQFDMAINPNNLVSLPEAHNGRGVAKFHLGKNREAMEDYNKAIELKDDFAGAYNNRGLVKYQLGQNEEAISDFNEAIASDPKHAQAYSNRGNVKLHLGEKLDRIEYYWGARRDYWLATKYDSNYANPHFHLGCVQIMFKHLSEALESFSRVIDIQPSYTKAYYERGRVYATLEEKEKARSDFLKAKELAEKDSDEKMIKLIDERLNEENLGVIGYEDKQWTLQIRIQD